MKEKVHTAKAKNLNMALNEAESFFGTSAENLEIKVVQKPRNLFGINLTPIIVEASLKKEKEVDVDGTFLFYYHKEGVVLKLVHPKGSGKPTNEDDIIESVYQRKIHDVDFAIIAEALVSKKDEALIAPFQEKEEIYERVQITFNSDNTEAYIELFSTDDCKLYSYDEIVSIIAENGVAYGIDYDIIKSLAENRIYGKLIKFASGKQPENGSDGKIEYVLDLSISNKPKYLDDGSVDYYEIQNYKTVFAGDVIAHYKKPVLGMSGYDVKGNEIRPYNGQDIKLPLGDQVMIAENGVDIIACVDGAAEIKGGKICVSNVLIINGNVDLSVGNLNFNGNIKILGNVLGSMSVTANGSIEINGSVALSMITAKGDIKIKRGVSGEKKGVIKAGGSVYADFLENTIVQAGKNVVACSIIHCDVESGDSIIASGNKGIIYGGKLKALNKISAKVIGSNANVVTVLELGVDPSVRNKYEQLKDKIQTLENELDYIGSIVSKPISNLNKRQEAILSKLIADRISKKYQLEGIKKEIQTIEKTIENEPEASVNVIDTIYPGTKITIRTSHYVVSSQNNYLTYKQKDNIIEALPYNDK